jgi:hypothetical protein
MRMKRKYSFKKCKISLPMILVCPLSAKVLKLVVSHIVCYTRIYKLYQKFIYTDINRNPNINLHLMGLGNFSADILEIKDDKAKRLAIARALEHPVYDSSSINSIPYIIFIKCLQ